MKPKYLFALILILAGTNIFTYATVRYWTTGYVLARAQERTCEALRKEGLDNLIYPPEKFTGQKPNPAVFLAIRHAGGMYYWWNDGLIYWGLGGILVVSGLLITQLDSKKT